MKALLFLIPLFLLSCGNEKVNTVEIYSYYPSGKLKAIGNYKDGKGNKQNVGVSFNELLDFDQSLQVIKPLLDSSFVIFDSNMRRFVIKPEFLTKVQEFNVELKTKNSEVELLILKNETDESNELMLLDLSSEEHRLGFEKIIGAKKSDNPQNDILIQLNPEGAQQFKEMTERNIGRKIAIVFNGKVLSAPIVHSVISAGEIQISGSFTVKEQDEMLMVVNQSVLNGMFKLFRENGKLKETRTYEKGEQVGSWTTYDENGKKLKTYKPLGG